MVLRPALLRERDDLRDDDAALEEAVGLVAAIDVETAWAETVRLGQRRPATLFGTGKVDEVRQALDADDPRPDIVVVDAQLTPVQHRNLEKAWNAKVLDRTALILEIFGERAQTKEGTLQVALAHLTYQRSRLVRSWTHLERQRGGAGFLGGPGERQIEADRRVLATKISRLEKQLEEVRRTRTLQRAKRKRAPHPVVALVGYTNAGKSTLFNRITGASVMSEDLLFATLDPTMRAVELTSRTKVILSDTVGFVSDLPTTLVAAFRATLEEVLEADVIVHVRDISHPETEAQRRDVLDVLGELGVKDEDGRRVIEVWNKIDRLSPEDRSTATTLAQVKAAAAEATLESPMTVAASAITGEGTDAIEETIDRMLTIDHRTFAVRLSLSDGAPLSWLHDRAKVLDERHDESGVSMVVRMAEKEAGQFESRFRVALRPVEATRKERLAR